MKTCLDATQNRIQGQSRRRVLRGVQSVRVGPSRHQERPGRDTLVLLATDWQQHRVSRTWEAASGDPEGTAPSAWYLKAPLPARKGQPILVNGGARVKASIRRDPPKRPGRDTLVSNTLEVYLSLILGLRCSNWATGEYPPQARQSGVGQLGSPPGS